MSRLIDADALIDLEEMEFIYFKSPAAIPFYKAHAVWDVIEKAPTINPESLRPHGRWTAEHTCTHCGEYALTVNLEDSEGEESQLYYHTPSCPWCGAKMDLEGT